MPVDLVRAGFIKEEHQRRQHYAAVILEHHMKAGRLRRIGIGVYEIAPHEITEDDRSLDGGVPPGWVPTLDGKAREQLLTLVEKVLGASVRSLVGTATGKSEEDVLQADRFLRFLGAERSKDWAQVR